MRTKEQFRGKKGISWSHRFKQLESFNALTKQCLVKTSPPGEVPQNTGNQEPKDDFDAKMPSQEPHKKIQAVQEKAKEKTKPPSSKKQKLVLNKSWELPHQTAKEERAYWKKIRALEQEQRDRRRRKPERSKHFIGKPKDLGKLRRVIDKK
jgi:hypothetical protein